MPERLWNLGDYTTDEERATADIAGLVSLGIHPGGAAAQGAAVVHHRCGWAAHRFGAFVKFHPGYHGLDVDLPRGKARRGCWPIELDDQAMAQSSTMAGLAVRRLGLPQSASSFLANFRQQRSYRSGAAHHSHRAVEQRGGAQGECPGDGVPSIPRNPAEKQQKLVIQGIDQQLSLAGQHADKVAH